MKYGLLYNENNINIGDDIQALATSYFLPHIDYMIDRENIDRFQSENNEPVAVIMNAWYMWHKWHWPPSRCIVPDMVGFHYADHQLAKQPGSPIKYEFLTGIGGDYLRAYGPVGTRDYFTRDQLQANGIDAYFSGCITLTLPQMPKKDLGRYICLVDVDKRVANKIQKQMKNSGIEVRVMTHNKKRNPSEPWEERQEKIKERLTIYQNAICVVTKRLHCALPCLAMQVPVFLVKGMTDDIRFSPYYDFMHRTTPDKFLKDQYEYDFANPPANPDNYKKVREDLTKSIREFVDRMEQETGSTEDLCKTTYTDLEMYEWRNTLIESLIPSWKQHLMDDFNKIEDLEIEYIKLLKANGSYRTTLSAEERRDRRRQTRMAKTGFRQQEMLTNVERKLQYYQRHIPYTDNPDLSDEENNAARRSAILDAECNYLYKQSRKNTLKINKLQSRNKTEAKK